MLNIVLPIIHIEIERWKYNKEHDVWVSSFGKAKKKDLKPLKERVGNNGYMYVYTSKGPKSLHRLVAETYLGKSDLTVDHIDSNKRNNKLSNLEYVSEEENVRRAKEKILVVNESQAVSVTNSESTRKICNGTYTFKNMKKAINFVVHCTHCTKSGSAMSTKSIESELLKAAENNASLFGYKWYFK